MENQLNQNLSAYVESASILVDDVCKKDGRFYHVLAE